MFIFICIFLFRLIQGSTFGILHFVALGREELWHGSMPGDDRLARLMLCSTELDFSRSYLVLC